MRKYILSNSFYQALKCRIIAKSIDFFIALMLSVLLFPLGVFLAAIYLAVKDSLFDGQSIGKKIMGFGVISLEDGKACSMKQSIMRNCFFSASILISLFPFWGWVFSFLLFISFCGFELYLLFKWDSAHRFGDVIAETTVIGDDQFREDLKRKKIIWMNPNASRFVQKVWDRNEKISNCRYK